MTIIELEPVIEEEITDKNESCHLYNLGMDTALCGFPISTHSPVAWEKGSAKCPGCGNLVCVACLLIAS